MAYFILQEALELAAVMLRRLEVIFTAMGQFTTAHD